MEEQIRIDYTQSIKDKDTLKKTTLSLLINSINLVKKDLKMDETQFLTDDQINDILVKEAKKRNQSIDLYTQSQRIDLATKEEEELNILLYYMPRPLTDDELKEIVKKLKEENPGIIEGKLIGLTNKAVNGRNNIDEIRRIIIESR